MRVQESEAKIDEEFDLMYMLKLLNFEIHENDSDDLILGAKHAIESRQGLEIY